MTATPNLSFRAKREIFPGLRNRAEIKLNHHRTIAGVVFDDPLGVSNAFEPGVVTLLLAGV